MEVPIPSLPQFNSPSSSSSVLPSDSISQVASTLTEPDASGQRTTKRRKLRATTTWDHFREAQGNEPRIVGGRLLHYCTHCHNPSWSTHISGNARYHLEKTHHILVREDSKSQDRRQLAIENAFARTAVKELRQVKESEMNTRSEVRRGTGGLSHLSSGQPPARGCQFSFQR